MGAQFASVGAAVRLEGDGKGRMQLLLYHGLRQFGSAWR